ncbi:MULTISPECIES: extracellular solute-binding protein [Bacillota]|uniref:Extracellular solute-binding protein n=1 Tax=Amedibacillus hominis TaxID=2897776 RepID=A0ABS9RD57_9FIRM|nr:MULTISPECIES: extracellular solute-binding protein [Bacillota]MCH4287588.1 extracellular solute-binding protein [Amedibacillus hominis]RGB48609.1 extracellular solute-binding protein [Absiella sp. AM22-9]RGB52672.1 extracellular solute-binding protein [Absiella sp. AM10-20]RGB67475.1 extracellular solute-binding protein [Absiella sp. AM09-45]RGB76840.1 extracellular solute-binding protein [Absiella sp. AM09-50]
MKDRKFSRRLILALVLVFFYFPILYMLVFSFNGSRSLTSFDGFSLQWYTKMFHDRNMMEAIYYTLVTAIIATFVSTIVGTITAIGLSKSKRIVKEVVQQINDLPIMNPEIVTAVGLMLFYVSMKMEKGFLTMLLAHIAFCTPYVILSVMPKLRSLDPNLAEAAMDLGAKPSQAMWKVIVPQIMPGIVSGALIAFTMSFDDFTISYFVTGNGVKNISTLVWTMSKRINPSINSLSTIIVLMITITLLIVNVLPVVREKAKKKNKPISNRVFGVIGVCIALVFSGILYGLKGGMSTNSPQDAIAKYGSDTLKVYNWGEYIDPEVNDAFEKQFGVKVIYDTFDSNELMYTKLQGGESYDVLVPSDYMIQRLIGEDYLQPLDKRMIPNIAVLADGVKGLSYDPDNTYSVPYFWGTVGIVYNKNNIDKKDLEKEGWNIFLDQKYKGHIYMYDSERDSFMMALKALGYSMNTDDEAQLQQAYEWLVKVVDTMNPEIVTDEVIDAMINGNKDMALVYSGDAAYILSENEEMAYYMPSEGTNLWSDAMVIPKNAKNPKLANEYINFILEYENSMKNSVFVGYASSNGEVLDTLSGEGGDFEGNEAYLPRVGYPKDEIFEFNEKAKKIMSNLWTKVKIAN